MDASAGSSSFDIVIAGGGLVGATLALALARQQCWRIALIEKTALRRTQLDELLHPSFDARNTALSNGSCELFDQLGIWSIIKPHAEAIRHIEVSDRGGPAQVLIDASEERVAALGYVVENRWIGHALLDALRDEVCVALFEGAEFVDPFPATQGFTGVVDCDKERQALSCRLLVVADGADSATCRRLGIGFRQQSYGQTGIVAALRAEKPHDGWAWERFTAEGPLAMLPQTDNRVGITWCVEPAHADRLMVASDEDFLAALQEVAGLRAGRFLAVGARHAYPLRKVVADEQVRPGLVVLGNAAHTMHPVAGQGLNMALRDVVELVRMVAEARASDRSPGEFALLQRYFGARTRDQDWTQHFADRLVRLFSNAYPATQIARNLGLGVFDLMPGAKHALARNAMGRAVSMKIPGAISS
jgi:2-octaprenyl-6-methoxyphenol hydroxylase